MYQTSVSNNQEDMTGTNNNDVHVHIVVSSVEKLLRA